MTKREQKVAAIIAMSIEEGYAFVSEGTGRYDELFTQKKAEGYDVRCYYSEYHRTKPEQNRWTMYAKKKERAPKKVVTPDYASMTVKELRKICSTKKITGYAKMNKQQIVEALVAC